MRQREHDHTPDDGDGCENNRSAGFSKGFEAAFPSSGCQSQVCSCTDEEVDGVIDACPDCNRAKAYRDHIEGNLEEIHENIVGHDTADDGDEGIEG